MNYDYNRAKEIILSSLRTHKLLSEFKDWENLDYDARSKALNDFKQYRKCSCGCKQFYKLEKMVSRWNNKKQDQELTFYKHAGHTAESFANLRY